MWNICLVLPQCNPICTAHLGEQETQVKSPLIKKGGHRIQVPTLSWQNIPIKLLGKTVVCCPCSNAAPYAREAQDNQGSSFNFA